MRILVTGSDGFIGRHLVRVLNPCAEVLGLQRRKPSGTHAHATIIQADLAEDLPLDDPVDVIVHAAGRSPDDSSTFESLIRDNVRATSRVAEFALRQRVGLIVYLSSVSVYGRIEEGEVDESTPFREPGFYGLSKYFAEQTIAEISESVPSLLFRLPIVMGAGMSRGWLSNTYRTLEQGLPLTIFNGDSPYNMVSLEGLCGLIRENLSGAFQGSQTFTLSCSDLLSIREIVELLRSSLDSKSEIREEKKEEAGFVISSEKAIRVLNYRPQPARTVLHDFLKATRGNDTLARSQRDALS